MADAPTYDSGMPSTQPPTPAAWTVTTDRNGTRAYALTTGQVVCKDGTGTTPVTVYYAGFHDWTYGGSLAGFGMTATVTEAKAWAEIDANQNARQCVEQTK